MSGYRRLIGAAGMAGLILGGCGSSGSDFTSKAEKACTDGHQRILAANPVPGDAGLNQQAAGFESLASALQGIKAPSDKQAPFQRLITDYQKAAAAQRSAATTTDRIKLAQALTDERAAFTGVKADGKAAGLATCAAQVTSG